MIKKSILIIIIILSAILTARAEWSEPVNMGPMVNSELYDNSPTVSSDGRLIIFHRSGQNGLNDLFYSEMTDTGWTLAQPFPEPINYPGIDEYPCLTRDDSRLYFSSNRPGSYGWNDIWYVDRDTITGEWFEPVHCDSPLNTTDWQGPMTVTGGHHKMYYNTGSILGPIACATWDGERWGNIEHIGSIIVEWNEFHTTITSDESELYFKRVTIQYGASIYYTSKYDTCSDCWNTSVRLPGIINDYSPDTPFITGDGLRLYFSGYGLDSYGGKDIYYSDYMTSIKEEENKNDYSLNINTYPNPFNSAVNIAFKVNDTFYENLDVRIYNILGEVIHDFYLNQVKPETVTKFTWDGTDKAGNTVSSGIYFCILQANGKTLGKDVLTLLK